MDRKIGDAIDVYGFAFTGSSVNSAAVYESQFAVAKQHITIYKDIITHTYLDSSING